jgi:hypothetical protein
MNKSEISSVIKKLEATMNVKYIDSSEFAKKLSNLNYQRAILAVEHIQKNGILNYGEKVFKLPSIPQFLDIYNSLQSNDIKKNDCIVCGGTGGGVHSQVINDIKYEFALHCDECGTAYISKDGYYTEPISKYYDIDNIKAQNAFRDKNKKPIPDYIKDLCRKLKLNINAILNPKGREGGAV